MAGKHFNITVFIRWAAEEMELEEAYRASLVKVVPSPRLSCSMHRRRTSSALVWLVCKVKGS